jgi:hypothetical protein
VSVEGVSGFFSVEDPDETARKINRGARRIASIEMDGSARFVDPRDQRASFLK